jgi:hypothetical protein
MTERARYVFTVKESPSGRPWLYMDLLDGISPLEHGFIGFDLEQGTSLDQAKEIANFINSKLVTVSYTDLRNV